jgi:hypothetical protein
MRIEKWIHVDLELDEVVMIQHTFVKRLHVKYQSMMMLVEKVCYDIIDSDNPERCVSTEKYTLFIIASYDALSNKELVKILDKMQSNGIKVRGDK